MATRLMSGHLTVHFWDEDLRVESNRGVEILFKDDGNAVIWIFPVMKPDCDEADGIHLPEPIAARFRESLLG